MLSFFYAGTQEIIMCVCVCLDTARKKIKDCGLSHWMCAMNGRGMKESKQARLTHSRKKTKTAHTHRAKKKGTKNSLQGGKAYYTPTFFPLITQVFGHGNKNQRTTRTLFAQHGAANRNACGNLSYTSGLKSCC